MFRRCTSVFVMIGLLASNLAAVPHAHAGMSAADQKRHDATPHFHGHRHHHADDGHSHAHEGHHHPHRGGVASFNRAAKPAKRHSVSDDFSVAEHVATAIIVPAQNGAVTTDSRVNHKLSPPQPLFVGQLQAALLPAPWRERSITCWHPPDKVRDASDTYLTLRNLRL